MRTNKQVPPTDFSRRGFIQKSLAVTASAYALSGWASAQPIADSEAGVDEESLPEFTGPEPNPYWNAVGPVVAQPQKAPLILLTDRPVQLETPRHYFLNAFTPNEAFYVRWHLETLPNSVDLTNWRLQVQGNVDKPLSLSFTDLLTRFKSTSLAAVNQCSGNSRSRLQPRVAGGQWGNGAMGNALWTGVKLRDLLVAAGAKSGSLQVQFEGLDRGLGPAGLGSNRFMKSLDLSNPAVEETLVAYAMNDEPLPMLNGFPVRLIVPGYFATYWVKALTNVRLLDKVDDNFWMKAAYRIPDTPGGTTTPDEFKTGRIPTVPISRMPVRSFLISPDGSAKVPAGLPIQLKGIAFSGYGGVKKVEISLDDGVSWKDARLGEDYGTYSFRTWSLPWSPTEPGIHRIAVRATDEEGNIQPDKSIWNPSGYMWNRIERQEITVGRAS